MMADKMVEIEKKMETQNPELRMEMKQKDGEVWELRQMVEKLEAQNAELFSQLQEVEKKSVARGRPANDDDLRIPVGLGHPGHHHHLRLHQLLLHHLRASRRG